MAPQTVKWLYSGRYGIASLCEHNYPQLWIVVSNNRLKQNKQAKRVIS